MNNKNLNPYQFNQKASLGSLEPVQDENSGNINDEFKPEFSLWCASYTHSINQRFSLEGTKLADTTTIIIRHNKKIHNKLVVKYQDVIYEIVDLSVDDSNSYLKYDYLTLKVNDE